MAAVRKSIGTTIKRKEQVRTETDQLLVQAIIRDRETFFDDVTFRKHSAADGAVSASGGHSQASAGPTNPGGAVLLIGCLMIVPMLAIAFAAIAFVLKNFK